MEGNPLFTTHRFPVSNRNWTFNHNPGSAPVSTSPPSGHQPPRTAPGNRGFPFRTITFGESVRQYLWLVRRSAFLALAALAVMSGFRLLLFFYFSDAAPFGYLADGSSLLAFLVGFRFDLKVVSIFALPIVLIITTGVLVGNQRYSRFLAWVCFYYCLASYSLIFLLLILDVGFFDYFREHLNFLIFGFLEDDTIALVATIAKHPKVIIPLFMVIVTLGGTYLAVRHFLGRPDFQTGAGKSPGVPASIVIIVAVPLLVMVGARGSLGLFPLRMKDAAITSSPFLNKLGTNGIFTLYLAVLQRMEERGGQFDLIREYGYGNRIQQAFSKHLSIAIDGNESRERLLEIFRRRTSAGGAKARIRPNVILVLMESMGSYWMNFNSDQFDILGELKGHFRSDYLFKNFLPAGTGTIGSLDALVLGLPSRQGAIPLTDGRYLGTSFQSAAGFPFKRQDYRTFFVYGGSLGWRNLQSFLRLQGFDEVLGTAAIKTLVGQTGKDMQHDWGVFDEYLFRSLPRILKSGDTPKFILALTTTNHPPFTLPRDYVPLPAVIPKVLKKRIARDSGEAEKRFLAYQYAARKLADFITWLKSSEFADNTILAVTGDHSFRAGVTFPGKEEFRKRAVPFYLYVPEALRPERIDTTVFGSHKDIMPTLYNLSLPGEAYYSAGTDLLDVGARHVAFNSSIMVADRGGSVLWTPCCTTRFKWASDHGGRVKVSHNNDHLRDMLEYYKATLSVTEYFLRSHLTNGRGGGQKP